MYVYAVWKSSLLLVSQLVDHRSTQDARYLFIPYDSHVKAQRSSNHRSRICMSLHVQVNVTVIDRIH